MSKRTYYSLRQRRRHEEKGLCRDCTHRAEPGRKSCKWHLAWAVVRKRNSRIRKRGLKLEEAFRKAEWTANAKWISHVDEEVPF